jgi:hypothetical protein
MQAPLLLVARTGLLLPISAATARQPLTLLDAQMDRMVAGSVASAIGLADGLCNLEAQTLTFTLGSADSLQSSAVAIGSSIASAASMLAPAAAISQSSAVARAPYFRQRRHAKIRQ